MKKVRIYILQCIFFLSFLLGAFSLSYAQTDRISITGYGEINYNGTFGESPDKKAADIYEEFGLLKEYSVPRNDIRFPGIGLVFTSNIMDEKLSFLTEINFKTRFNKIELGIERCYLNYSFSNNLNIQTGIYSTPIGSLNEVERNQGYLSNSIHIRDMVNSDLGLIPTRVFGLKIYGSFETPAQMAINYRLSIGSGRGVTPTQSPFEIDLFEEQESSMSLSGALEMAIPVSDGNLTIGFSGFTVPKFSTLYLDSLGVEVEENELDELMETESTGTGDVAMIQMKEYGFAPYIRLNTPKVEFIGEVHSTYMQGLTGDLEDQKFSYTGLSAEIAYKTTLKSKKFVPYIRYDYTKLPENGGYYYGLHFLDNELKRFMISNNSVLMVGASWNIFPFNKIKVEYGLYFDGPHPQHGVSIQSAFVF